MEPLERTAGWGGEGPRDVTVHRVTDRTVQGRYSCTGSSTNTGIWREVFFWYLA